MSETEARNTMKTRKEVAALVRRQLRESPDTSENYCQGKTPLDARPKGSQLHYGRQELRELLDFIYGGPPENDDERVD